MKRLRKIVRIIIIVINCLAASMLLLSYAAPFVNPADFWPLAAFGVIYPLLLAINLVFLVLWIIRWKWWVLISGVVLVAGIPLMMNFFRFRLPSPPLQRRPGIHGDEYECKPLSPLLLEQ